MKKLILLAGAAGLFLVAANVPGDAKEGELSSVLAAPAPAPVAKSAPVAAPAPAAAPRMARADTAYPRCSGAVQDRCIQGRGGASALPQRRIQLASRAGERG
ncbi:MAG TPA: hypothetical protein VIA98_04035 [Allosphingosinicella sp.]|jgi:hypothetical protein